MDFFRDFDANRVTNIIIPGTHASGFYVDQDYPLISNDKVHK